MAQEMRRTGQIGMVDGVALYLTPKAYLPDGAEFLIAVPLRYLCAGKAGGLQDT